jgi:hypothetical protein
MRLDLFGKLSTAVVTNEFYECIVNRLDPAAKSPAFAIGEQP